MKKFLMICGILFLIQIFLLITFFSYGFFMRERLNVSSKTYVERIVPVIASNWSEEKLLAEASPEFLEAINKEHLHQLFGQFSLLGKLKISRPAKGKSNISITFSKGMLVTADYEKEINFENAPAKISISLIQKHGDWKILAFRVDSLFFLK